MKQSGSGLPLEQIILSTNRLGTFISNKWQYLSNSLYSVREERRDMRAFKITSLFALAAIAVSACASAGGTGGDIKVAILAPLSGPVPTFGVSTRDGAL